MQRYARYGAIEEQIAAALDQIPNFYLIRSDDFRNYPVNLSINAQWFYVLAAPLAGGPFGLTGRDRIRDNIISLIRPNR